MSKTEQELAAVKIRCKALIGVHVERLAKRLAASKSCLVLYSEEKAIIVNQMILLLMEIYEGKTTLEPNHFQRAAAEAGKEDVTEADMLMFAAKLDMLQRMVGRQLNGPEQVKVIRHVINSQVALAQGKPEPVLNLTMEG